MSTWCDIRNVHIFHLKAALEGTNDGDIITYGELLEAIEFAIQKLEGLPEHWEAIDL